MAIIGQGAFTQGATAVSQIIQVPSSLDSLEVFNVTQSASGGATTNAVYSYWQRPVLSPAGVLTGIDSTGTKGIFYSATAAALSVGVSAANAFVLYDPSGNPLASAVAITSSTNATRPVFTLGSSAASNGLAAGDIVRVYGMSGQPNLNGYDFSIDDLDNGGNNFRWAAALATAPGAAGSGGVFRKIKFNPLFYPRHRYIVSISQAAQAVIKLSVPSGYKVGQSVRVIVPSDTFSGTAVWGMTQMNGLIGDIVAVDDTLGTQTITVNIDSSAMSAFTFPTAAQAATPFSKAMVVPVGEDTALAIAQSQNILSDATTNTGYLGMSLAAGALLPAGIASDTVVWRAVKADFGGL